jgi:hypothetical protein
VGAGEALREWGVPARLGGHAQVGAGVGTRSSRASSDPPPRYSSLVPPHTPPPGIPQDAMHAELLKSSASFDEETYAAAIGCALTLDRVDDLVNREWQRGGGGGKKQYVIGGATLRGEGLPSRGGESTISCVASGEGKEGCRGARRRGGGYHRAAQEKRTCRRENTTRRPSPPALHPAATHSPPRLHSTLLPSFPFHRYAHELRRGDQGVDQGRAAHARAALARISHRRAGE